MDLFEYQAKQLFQKYGVPVSLGEVATTPRKRAAAERIGGVTVVRRRSRSVAAVRLAASRSPRPPMTLSLSLATFSAWTSGATPSTRPRRRVRRFRRSTTSRTYSTAPTARSWRWPPTRAAWRSSSSRSSAPDALAKVPVDARAGVDIAKAREIVAAASSGHRCRTGRRRPGEAVGRLHRR